MESCIRDIVPHLKSIDVAYFDMLACIDVQSLRLGAVDATFRTSAAALVSALRTNGACFLQLSASDAEIVRHAVVEAKAGFQNAYGTRGTGTAELVRSNYRLASHKELFEVRAREFNRQHSAAQHWWHPAGAAAQEVSSKRIYGLILSIQCKCEKQIVFEA